MDFNFYFFRDYKKSVDSDKIFSFFSRYPEITYELKDGVGYFNYYDETLENKATFTIQHKLLVPNIFKIKSNFINLNFRMQMGEYVPYYKANIIFEIVQALCNELDLYIYNELFEDALKFDMNLIHEVYQYFKSVCKEKFPEEYQKYHYVETKKLSNILNYQKSNYELQIEYLNEGINAPSYMFLFDKFDVVRTAIKWKEGTDTIIPPAVDYIYYSCNNLETHIYAYSEVYEAIEKYLIDLPGFQKGTKITDSKENKKIKKLMKKSKFREVNMDFVNLRLSQLVD